MNKKRFLSLALVVLLAMSLMTVALATNDAAPAADNAVTTDAGAPAGGEVTNGEAPAEEGFSIQSLLGGVVGSPILIIVIMFAVMYFLLIRPENKKKKEVAKMREELGVGDEITTIGGIVGKVTTVRDEEITIETGSDRLKVRLKKWAVSTVDKKREVKEEKDA